MVKNWYLFVCVAAGLWGGLGIGLQTEYFTSNRYKPVQVGGGCLGGGWGKPPGEGGGVGGWSPRRAPRGRACRVCGASPAVRAPARPLHRLSPSPCRQLRRAARADPTPSHTPCPLTPSHTPCPLTHVTYAPPQTHKPDPPQDVADACRTGPATDIIFGLALGYKSTIIPCFVIAICIYIGNTLGGMLGIACAALGMLSTLSTGLAIDAYGPISDNAGGIAEMAGMGEDIRERTDALDAAGNTTAAIGKGFAIGSAALVSLALFGAYVTRAKIDLINSSILDPKARARPRRRRRARRSRRRPPGAARLLSAAPQAPSCPGAAPSRAAPSPHLQLRRPLALPPRPPALPVPLSEGSDPPSPPPLLRPLFRPSNLYEKVFAGLLVGAMLPFWFSAMTMKSVGKAALAMVEEVRGHGRARTSCAGGGGRGPAARGEGDASCAARPPRAAAAGPGRRPPPVRARGQRRKEPPGAAAPAEPRPKRPPPTRPGPRAPSLLLPARSAASSTPPPASWRAPPAPTTPAAWRSPPPPLSGR